MRINKLTPNVYNKIAAGEVVERPASIVKELVENSIDAGATLIQVKVDNGGIDKIQVTDNGCGINYQDLELAFVPHATSKISSVDDLFSIKSLGFRGEALASIGAVAEVSLVSKERTAETGGKIEISGGELVTPPTETASPNGTDITVSNLFFCVPARAKFLKKPKTEEGEITALMARFILSNPGISFKYIVDGKIKYLSSGKGLQDAIFVVYGKETLENSIYVERDFGYINIYGFIGKPTISKPNRTYETVIINGRYVESHIISSAVQNAYGEMLMKKQFPFFVLNVDIDFSKVDVNVHPNKKEVRFENSGDIYAKVFETVNRKINTIDNTRTIESPKRNEEPKDTQLSFNYVDEEEVVVSLPKPKEEPMKLNSSSEPLLFDSDSRKPLIEGRETQDIPYSELNKLSYQSSPEVEQGRRNIFSSLAILNDNDNSFGGGVSIGSKLLDKLMREKELASKGMAPVEDNIRLIGIVFNTYILAEVGDSLLIIDQHAGHERILYDKFSDDIESKRVDSQPLLVSYILKLNPIEFNFFSSIVDDLNAIGFEINEFGDTAFRVSSTPYALIDINLDSFFKSILSNTKELKSITIKDILKDRLASLACKSAVKAGDKLSDREAIKLLQLFKDNNNQLSCPHGRPVVIKIEKKELEKWFKRIV